MDLRTQPAGSNAIGTATHAAAAKRQTVVSTDASWAILVAVPNPAASWKRIPIGAVRKLVPAKASMSSARDNSVTARGTRFPFISTSQCTIYVPLRVLVRRRLLPVGNIVPQVLRRVHQVSPYFRHNKDPIRPVCSSKEYKKS